MALRASRGRPRMGWASRALVIGPGEAIQLGFAPSLLWSKSAPVKVVVVWQSLQLCENSWRRDWCFGRNRLVTEK